MDSDRHEFFMRAALRQAQLAAEEGEVPAGCVVTRAADELPFHAGATLASAHNQVERLRDPTAHAEMIAITQAAAALGDWRLTETVLYVTKEPCPMCAGAIVLARIPLVVYGAPDPDGGGMTTFGILQHPGLNHRCEVIGGILDGECRSLLQEFFRRRRSDGREKRLPQVGAPL
jgi:tRNA(adenine34) deaminase